MKAGMAGYTQIAVLAVGLSASAVCAAPQKLTIKDKQKYYDIEMSYPKTGIAAIDRDLEEWAKQLAEEFREGSADAKDNPMIKETGGNYSAELSYDIARDDDQVFSVTFQYYTYSGGAHPNTMLYARNYLKPEGRRVFIAELVGPGGIKAISDFAKADLKKQWRTTGGGDDEWLGGGAGPWATNFEAFAWKADRLVIDFPAYQVASYAEGPQEVTIPLSKLKAFMRPDPRAPLPSFDCAKAGTPIERAICVDWETARADRQMAEAYSYRLRNSFEKGEKEKVLAEQKAWLKSRDQACGGMPQQGMKTCLMPLLAARKAELERVD